MRLLTTETRMKLEEILNRLSNGSSVSLNERIELKKVLFPHSIHRWQAESGIKKERASRK